ncbi:hypothetical protein FEDK69T_30010 [Flavobacterium enshiense DK69]|uniref:Uncharacterized protein n=1 Tax=Flavobacterium enshiense DK69 TaxID=1107311 RepID=V6S1C3_9FLAO|nr:hypothetical protein [Flavobacterium enshiense]ESU20478.1 hypothetical protein FEDK69T_30010 [Flavobacterium enshiense DK69]KGO95719.1 hypothetical protein Q767_08465 [Flavobacterium enshiense DK69]
MKFYYYLLFRIHKTLSKNKNYSEKDIVIFTSLISSIYILFLMLTIYFTIDVFYLHVTNYIDINKLSFVFILLGISYLNYYFIIRNKKYLDHNFNEDKMGGYLIIASLGIIFTIFIIIANKNRERLNNDRKITFNEKQLNHTL